MRKTILNLALLCGALVGSGCSAGGGVSNANPNGGNGGNGGTGGGSFGGTGPGGFSGSVGGGMFVPGTGGGQMLNPDAACREYSERAEAPLGGKADVIFVLDNSGSMTEEAIAVQNNMNAFSQLIIGQGISANVVVISSGPNSAVAACAPNDWVCLIGAIALAFAGSNGVCIEPPLGMAGACPNGDDTNLTAGYMHWRQEVGSNN